MKTVLLEMFLVLESVALWTFALPVAAILFVFALLWKKALAAIAAEVFGPPKARLSHAAA